MTQMAVTPHRVPRSTRVRALIEDVIVEMSEELDASATAVTDAIHRACSGLGDELYLATRQSTRANLGLITTLMADGAEPTDFSAPEEALAYARSFVHEGLSFDLLTRAYRQGEHAYTRMWLHKLHARAHDSDELADSMRYVGDWLFAYIDAINGPLGSVYTAEHERWVRGGLAMRSEEVRAILAGAEVDVTQASGRLRYRLDGRHLAFVIWSTEPREMTYAPERRVFEEIDRLGAQVAETFGSTSVLLLPMGGHHAGWIAVRGERAVAEPDAARLPTGPGGLRVALGRVGRELPGFRRSYTEALLAKRVASLAERPPVPGLAFGTVALDALMTSDLDEARRFVGFEIGPLMDGADTSRRLLATIEVFLQEESSYVRAARRLGVHENTVAYRVRQAEEVLGRRVGERQLELRAALRLAHLVRGHSSDAPM